MSTQDYPPLLESLRHRAQQAPLCFWLMRQICLHLPHMLCSVACDMCHTLACSLVLVFQWP